MTGKVCTKCGIHKAFSEFNHRANASDGRYSACRSCDHASQRAYRAAHPERQRAWVEANRPRQRAHASNWLAGNHVQKRTHMEVTRAVARGILTRPEACSRCGKVARIEAHHEDYRLPLEVVWLCTGCHHDTPHEAARASALAITDSTEPGPLQSCEERERDLRDALLEASYYHVTHDGRPRHPETCHDCRRLNEVHPMRVATDSMEPGL